MNPNRLLVIDDEPDIGKFIGMVAEELDLEVVVTSNSDEFWNAYRVFDPSIIVLDLLMPEVDGVELLRMLAKCRCQAHIMVASGADTKVLATARLLGVDHGLNMLGTLRKPVRLQNLRTMLRKVFKEEQTISEDDLRQAIEDDQLIVHYQPKADLGSTRLWHITACEALVRWEHPRYGTLMPGEFIPLAESSGIILPLTNCVLRKVMEQLRLWNEDGLVLSVSVNIAPQLLSDLALPDQISGLVKEFDTDPSRLILEITESGAMTDTALTMDILTRFRLKGFGLSIDDFGTGYSSLVQLHRMPFNEMKIDRSFVGEIGVNGEAEKIVRSIVDLGHNLGLSLCAEGIETQEALRFLRSLGCETAQGYLISKPVPPADLAAFVHGLTGPVEGRAGEA